MRRYLHIVALLVCMFPGAAWALDRSAVATDNFNRASLGSNWTQLNPGTSNLIIGSSTFLYSDAGAASGRWDGAGSFSADQYAKMTVSGIANLSTAYWIGVVCRASPDINGIRDMYFYVVYADSATSQTTEIGKYVDGSYSSLTSTTIAWTAGDTIEIECEGTTIRGYKNGVQQQSTTDSSLSSGHPGATAAGNSTSVQGDNWEGGNLVSSSGNAAVRRRVQ